MMSEFNRTEFKERRKELRKNATKAEVYLWGFLRGRGLGVKFYRQYSVGGYVLDFYCPKFHLAVELDGGYHDDAGAREYDALRSDFLKGYGIKVVRFRNEEVFGDTKKVLDEIKFLCVPPLELRGG